MKVQSSDLSFKEMNSFIELAKRTNGQDWKLIIESLIALEVMRAKK